MKTRNINLIKINIFKYIYLHFKIYLKFENRHNEMQLKHIILDIYFQIYK